MRLLFYPIFENNVDITDHFYRLHWYLYPFREEIGDVVMLRRERSIVPGPIPEVLDQSITSLVEKLPVSLVEPSSEREIGDRISEADCVLLWHSDDSAETKQILKGKKVVRIDHHSVQHAASFYLKFHEKFPSLQDGYLERSEKIFQRIAQRCVSDTGYIFGTGPGLSLALERGFDFSDGVCIACNSMVRNHELLEQIKPPLIVVADPIFHAGPSSYAAAFRQELVAALDKYNSDLIVPMRDYHIYLHHLPSRFSDRIAAVPFQAEDSPNLDLLTNFHVTATGNILTLFLLPLASTFFNKIRIMGCDGRPLEENSYFWGHDKASQFNDKMSDIQKAHPSFFAIDFDDYYLTHCKTLETWLTATEARGKTIENQTPTYIPALLERSIPDVGKPERAEPPTISPSPVVSIIMPAFNAAPYIEEAIKSVINQSFENWELLIVDDGSTDETAPVVRELANRDDRIKLLRNPGKGVSSARNHGVNAAKGSLIAFLDADDNMDPGSLESRASSLLTDNSKHFVHSCVRFIDENGRDLKFEVGSKRTVTFPDMSGNPANINTIMGRASLIKGFPFPENIKNGEDWMMVARILRSGISSHYVPEGTATYRIHRTSTVIKDMEVHERSLKEVIEWVHSKADEENIAPMYRDGLPAFNKSKVFSGRLLNLLMWNVWEGAHSKTSELLSIPDVVAEVEATSPSTLRRRVMGAGVRRFSIPSDELALLAASERKKIIRNAIKGGLARQAPLLFEQFKAILEEPTSIISSASLDDDRPFYASFGEWLMWRLPRLFRFLQRGRRSVAGGYMRAGKGFRVRLPIAFRITQMLAWAARSAWRHKLSVLLLLIVCTALVIAPLLDADLWLWRYLAWPIAAGLLGLAMAGAVMREAFHRIIAAQSAETHAAVRNARQAARKQADDLAQRVQKVQASLERGLSAEKTQPDKALQALNTQLQNALSSQQSALAHQMTMNTDLAERLLQAESALTALREGFDGGIADLVAKLEKQGAGLSAISHTVARQEESKSQNAQRLDQAEKDFEAIRKDVEAKMAEVIAASEARAKELTSISDGLKLVETQPSALDVVSGMRALRPLWFGASAVEALRRQPEIEHGHALLMAVLADEARGRPDFLTGKTLIEIGTTREHDPRQSSTQKLALFTGMTDMHFVTVDMDPANTKSTAGYLRYFNPVAQAVTAKGEDYLGIHAGALDFVYLDAFDFDHGKHSEERQAHYRENLHTEINDFECWTMHESCARIIAERMPVGGIVAADDTWTDANGDLAGKGKLAVPLLLDSGFEIVASTKMTIALKRTSMNRESQRSKSSPRSRKKTLA